MPFRIFPRRNATKERTEESYHDSHCASDADQLRCSLRGDDGSDDGGNVVVVVGSYRCLFRGHQLTAATLLLLLLFIKKLTGGRTSSSSSSAAAAAEGKGKGEEGGGRRQQSTEHDTGWRQLSMWSLPEGRRAIRQNNVHVTAEAEVFALLSGHPTSTSNGRM